jgi:hypothetical protein
MGLGTFYSAGGGYSLIQACHTLVSLMFGCHHFAKYVEISRIRAAVQL